MAYPSLSKRGTKSRFAIFDHEPLIHTVSRGLAPPSKPLVSGLPLHAFGNRAAHDVMRRVLENRAPRFRLGLLAPLVLAVALAAIGAACATSGKTPAGPGGSGVDGGGLSADGAVCLACGGDGDGAPGLLPSASCTQTSPCNDFSDTAGASCANGECVIIDGSGPTPVPSNPGSLFGSPSASGGPCLVEPQDGTLFPNAWLRPRISFAPGSQSQSLFQIRLHSAAEVNDLVVYTTSTSWTLDKATWTRLSGDLGAPTVSVTVAATSAAGGGAALSQTATFAIAPVPALGALIYWTASSYDTSATTTNLKGFHIGDEGTTVALNSAQVTQKVDAVPAGGGNLTSAPVAVTCIGCHTSTPDGNYVAFTAQWPWPNALASVNGAADGGVPVGQPPPWLTAGAAANLSPMLGPASANGETFWAPPIVNQVMLGVQTFSPAHYSAGDRVVVSSLGASQNALSIDAGNTLTGVVSQLAWFDLEWGTEAPDAGFAAAPCGTNPAPPGSCLTPPASNGGWGILARTGDSQSAGAPSWSHNLDGNTDLIAYTSTDVGTKDGRLDQGNGDVYLVPYNARKGGTATPLAGASDKSFNEYYPAWSPDDALIAFNRVPSGDSMYNQPHAEVYVVALQAALCDGSTSAQCRLRANDPVACTSSKSPGVQNTWPKWAPAPEHVDRHDCRQPRRRWEALLLGDVLFHPRHGVHRERGVGRAQHALQRGGGVGRPRPGAALRRGGRGRSHHRRDHDLSGNLHVEPGRGSEQPDPRVGLLPDPGRDRASDQMTLALSRHSPMRRLSRWLAMSLLAGAACATSGRDRSEVSGAGDAGDVDGGLGSIPPPGDDDSGISLGSGGSGGGTLGSCVSTRACISGCTDFGGSPILDGNATAFDPSTSTSGGPCIVEPGDGSLLPNNWVRPRFKWQGGTPPYKLTIHSGREASDLVVFTSNTQWTMPKTTWQALAASAWDDGSGSDAIGVTVGDAQGGTATTFSIAPANANGSMVYWTAAGDVSGWSWLEGFGVGDETVSIVLTAPTGPYANTATQDEWGLSRDVGGNLTTTNRDTNVPLTPIGGVECIGCHVAAPDTKSVAFVDFYPWDGVTSAVDPAHAGTSPAWLSPGGAETLSQGWLGMMTFSPAVWGPGAYRVVAGSQVPATANSPPWSAGSSTTPSNLIWIDLGTTAAPSFSASGAPLPSASSSQTGVTQFYANRGTTFGVLSRSGDPNPSASCPAWSHDGNNIVYVSNNAAKDGRLDVGTGDLYVVPYNSGMGGSATPLSGAASAALNEYYPAYSPDDQYVAFTGAPAGQTMYYNRSAEVYVVPSKGGTATRLAANDPPACLGAASPGVTNSWPRWSPEHPSCGGKTYYWLIFSSSRSNTPFTVDATKKNFKAGAADGPTSQLYLTALVDDGSGGLKTSAATYIWNQSTKTADGFAQSNHTPAWEVVSIPPPPPPK